MQLSLLKKYWAGVVFVALVVATLALQIQQRFFPHVASVSFGGARFTVLLADTQRLQFTGLSNRDSLGTYDGMLFIFPEPGKYTMVMRDMRFPLDIVWINGNQVVHIEENIPLEPGKTESQLTPYSSDKLANLVLEAPAGFVRKNRVTLSSTVQVSL